MSAPIASLTAIPEEPKFTLTVDDPQFKEVIEWMTARFRTKSNFLSACLKKYCLTVLRSHNHKRIEITIEFGKSQMESGGYLQIHTTFAGSSGYEFLSRNISWRELTQSPLRANELCDQIWYCLPIHGRALSSTFTALHTRGNFKKIADIMLNLGEELGFVIKESIICNDKLRILIDISFSENPLRMLTVVPHASVGYQVIVTTTLNGATDMISRILYRDSKDYEFLMMQLCGIIPALVPRICK
jgi:hypothetical protein